MESLKITIDVEGSAFSEGEGTELGRIFDKLARDARSGSLHDSKKILDINGNCVGRVEIT